MDNLVLTREIFCYLVDNNALISHLDQQTRCCRYIFHWTHNMNHGRWIPRLNELDFELAEIKNSSELYDFITNKLKEKEDARPK